MLIRKTRVVFESTNERNYHIFYFLRQGLQLNETKIYYMIVYLLKFIHVMIIGMQIKKKHCTMVNVNNSNRYIELKESLGLMRIGAEIQPDLW